VRVTTLDEFNRALEASMLRSDPFLIEVVLLP
jgi:hypothetical protein